ncbi:MAG: hypothetical protein SPI15_10825 [Candidatus Faecousia sp.]|nr:hypothetical protein [Clostridiales bacterium]MDY6181324.1 hypothetical protein [Candidatus Faecousia sp.]
MAGFGKLALAALAASLLPYEVKKDDDGEFTYKSLLLGVKTKTDDEGKKAVELSFFNLPDFMKNTAPKAEEAPAEEAPAEEVPAEEAPAEEPAAEEAPADPVEETPAPAEEPVNE